MTPRTVACQPPLSMEFSRQEYWNGLPLLSPGDLPDPGIEPRSPALQTGSLLSEPPGKPKNTGVASLSLLQGIFLTQESNQGLLHCRQILYQLSYHGRPKHTKRALFLINSGIRHNLLILKEVRRKLGCISAHTNLQLRI